jgi:hypothetical protein
MSIEKQKTAKAPKRATRVAMTFFRFTRNLLAVCGVLFVYLLYTGYQQYQDRLANGDITCGLTRCI